MSTSASSVTVPQITLDAASAPTPTYVPALTFGADSSVGLVSVGSPLVTPGSAVLTVGVGKQFTTIAAAVAAATNGTTILVDAGTYTNDFAVITTSLTLEGVGGMVNMVATRPPPNLKGIITVDNNVSIANFTFSGSAIGDDSGGNGAGIRYEGGVMSLYNDSFSNNQDGILAFPVLPQLTTNTITINHCVFNANGSGTGYTHNLYIGNVSSLVFENSISMGANVGHEFKSRANNNTITNNLFTDGATGDASYEIDLPNGGAGIVTGNTIIKGPNAQNSSMVHFGGEGIPYAGSSLTLSGNKFVNNFGPDAIAVLNQTAISVTISGNQFTSVGSGKIVQGPAGGTGNVDGQGNALPDISQVGVLPGNTTIFTDNVAHTVTLTESGSAVQGGGGLLTVYDPAGHIIVIGGSGGLDFYESLGAGGSSITTLAGSVNIVSMTGQDLLDSEGVDTIVCGGGNVTGTIGGAATVADGIGTDKWVVNGAATFTEAGGAPQFTVGQNGTASVSGSVASLIAQTNGGSLAFDVTNAGTETSLSITGGAASVSVWEGATSVATSGGGAGATVQLGAGTIQVASAGADTIYAGSGSDTVIVSGAASVYAGAGALSVFGRGDAAGASVFANGGTVTLDGDGGNITYFGGALDNTAQSKLSCNTFIGGAGRMTINGGSRETIIGGTGGIVFNEQGGGANTITTAAGAANTLNLSNADSVVSWGNDTINETDGNMQLQVFGTATINGSTGNSSETIFGAATLNGVGQDWVTLAAGATLTASAGLLDSISETGASLTFTVASGPYAGRVAVSGGAAQIVGGTTQATTITTAAGATTTVTVGAGPVKVASNGSDVIYAGSGANTVTITAANTVLWGGTGSLTVGDYDKTNGDAVTVHGGSGAITYAQGGSALTFLGGSGSATLSGGWGGMTITGGSGALQVSGGYSQTRFVGGSGNATIALNPGGGDVTLGSGAIQVTEAGYGAADVYRVLSGVTGGTTTITGFRVNTDKIVEQAGVKAIASKYVGGATEIDFSNKSAIFLVGVHVTSRILAL